MDQEEESLAPWMTNGDALLQHFQTDSSLCAKFVDFDRAMDRLMNKMDPVGTLELAGRCLALIVGETAPASQDLLNLSMMCKSKIAEDPDPNVVEKMKLGDLMVDDMVMTLAVYYETKDHDMYVAAVDTWLSFRTLMVASGFYKRNTVFDFKAYVARVQNEMESD